VGTDDSEEDSCATAVRRSSVQRSSSIWSREKEYLRVFCSDRDSDESSADSEVSSASSTVKRVVDVEKTGGGEKDKNGAQEGDVEGEDTMANLTTTFAGIFGKANLK